MSLGDFLKYCPECFKRKIEPPNVLTTAQAREGKPCLECQKYHAQTLKERLDIVEQIREFNG